MKALGEFLLKGTFKDRDLDFKDNELTKGSRFYFRGYLYFGNFKICY